MANGIAIVIAVPVRDEAERLPRLLQALARQRQAPPFTLALFFDNCIDGSEALATRCASDLPYPLLTARCTRGGPPSAGLARRRAMALATDAAPRGMLMTTDADGEPAPDWISANLRALDQADVVAGRVTRSAGQGSAVQDRLEAYHDRLHALRRTLDPVTWEAPLTHHWTSGASLAMRSEVYHATGGFPAVANGEDAAFGDAAARLGLRTRRDATVRVETSARRVGRAENGFAATLAAWDRSAVPPAVSHPADEAWRFARQAEARRTHDTGRYHDLARRLCLPETEVEQVARECSNGEAFAARIVGAPPSGMRTVSLPEAERLLPSLEQDRLESAA